MKHLKKIMSLILTAIMVIAMCVPVMADDSNYIITINDNDKAVESFAAYQVFKGEISGGKLINIDWGKNISNQGKTALLRFGKAEGETAYADAAELAAALNNTNVKAFADEVSKYIEGLGIANVKNGSSNTISVPKADAGYYFIKNTGNADQGKAYTKFVMKVVADAQFTPKTDAPKIEKKIKNADEGDDAYRDYNNVSIGDTVNYRITSSVPNMEYYDKYYFIVKDTLSKGLTFKDSLNVKIGDDVLQRTDDDKVTGKVYQLNVVSQADGSTYLEIVFNNFIQYKGRTGNKIEITYSAELNNNAEKGETGNPNEVDLTYSNNPNEKGTGTNKPGDNDKVTGTTPKDYTITYTTDLGIYKYGATEADKLSGVKFRLVGFKNNDKTTYETTFKEAADGVYYRLIDNTYTTVAPTELTKKYYESETTKYTLTTSKGTYTESIDKYDSEVVTDANGFAKFSPSLAAGEYEIIEIETRDGYNMLPKPLKVKIECTTPDDKDSTGTEKATWTVTVDGKKLSVNADNNFEVKYLEKIQNKQGSTLPETGGIGTTIFYVVGVVLMLGAGVLLITKRRMSAKH